MPILRELLLLTLFVITCNAQTLPQFNADPKQTSVSGLSAGAFFATQLQVAYSSHICGAGIIAGGPYDCAAQRDYTACMYSSAPSVTTSISRVKNWSGNSIDDISHLAKHRVYMISGTSDTTVSTNVMNQVYKFYVTDSNFIAASNVVFKKDLNSAHTFPTDTDSTGNNGCSLAISPYISNCKFDGAGALLSHIYGTLNARNDGTLTGKFISFNQAEFLANAKSNGMDDTAYIYVPKTCSEGVTCKLHIAFHGCQQGYEKIGDKFIKNTGYARWADTNNMLVLFPQAIANSVTTITLPNPNGCWDWVGWYGNDFDIKSGKQLSAIKKIIDRITSGFNPLAAPIGVTVVSTGDHSVSLSWGTVSDAVGYNIYRNGQKVNTATITSTSYNDSKLSSGTTYIYTVRAVSSSATESEHSEKVTAKTTGEAPALSAPNSLVIQNKTDHSIALAWNSVENAANYNIYRNTNKIQTTSAHSYVDTELKPSTEYSYQVTAVNDLNESSKSNTVTATTETEKKCYTDNNYNHVLEGRAYLMLGFAIAYGSEKSMGLWNIFIITTLCRTADKYYVIE